MKERDNNQVILVDMDGTLADYIGALKRDLAILEAPEETFHFENFGQYPDYIGKRIDLIRKSDDWWLNLEPIEHNMKLYRLAVKVGFHPHILTKGPKRAVEGWSQKVSWVYKHLGEDEDISITRDKGLFYGKVLFDDYPEYAIDWLEWRPRGVVIMPKYDFNEDFDHPNVIHYSDEGELPKIRELLVKILNRGVREEIDIGEFK